MTYGRGILEVSPKKGISMVGLNFNKTLPVLHVRPNHFTPIYHSPLALATMAIAIALVICALLAIFPTRALAWGNGATHWDIGKDEFVKPGALYPSLRALRSALGPQAVNNIDEPFDNDNDQKSNHADGFGAHDYILEQALYQARRQGADLSWVNDHTAQISSDDPDNNARLKKLYWRFHAYRSVGESGAPSRVQQLYNEIVTALDDGDNSRASYLLGLLSHHFADISQPLHTESAKIFDPNMPNGLHEMYEDDVDSYMAYSIEKKRSNWSDESEAALAQIPLALTANSAGNRDARRQVWFEDSAETSASTKTYEPLNVTPRILTIRTALGVRHDCLPSFYAILKTVSSTKPASENYMTAHAPRKDVAGNDVTNRLLEPAYTPRYLATGADGLTRILLSLDDSATRSQWCEKPVSGTTVITAKARQGQTVRATTTVKDSEGNPLQGITVRYHGTRPGADSFDMIDWTDSKGRATITFSSAYHTIAPGTLSVRADVTHVNKIACTVSTTVVTPVLRSGPVRVSTRKPRKGSTMSVAVRVYDYAGRTVKGIPVKFYFKYAGGSVSRTVYSDSSGLARTTKKIVRVKGKGSMRIYARPYYDGYAYTVKTDVKPTKVTKKRH